MIGKTIAELTVGESATFTKTISETDIYLFAGISGDFNPAHVDEEYASQTVFKGRIAHGMLLAGFISTVLGRYLPGPGAIYLRQDLRFKAPARIGDTITAKAEVTEIIEDKNMAVLRTTCTNQDNILVVEGEATVSPKKAGLTYQAGLSHLEEL